MKNAKRRRPTGELRRTQLLTTYGPGSMVDLPDHAVLIGGLESWDGDLKPVYEPRLEAHLQRSLGVPRVVLKTQDLPPRDRGEFFKKPVIEFHFFIFGRVGYSIAIGLRFKRMRFILAKQSEVILSHFMGRKTSLIPARGNLIQRYGLACLGG